MIEDFYRDRQSVSIFGKAGTLIISNQQLAHKGWQKHDKNKRYALICFLIAEKNITIVHKSVTLQTFYQIFGLELIFSKMS